MQCNKTFWSNFLDCKRELWEHYLPSADMCISDRIIKDTLNNAKKSCLEHNSSIINSRYASQLIGYSKTSILITFRYTLLYYYCLTEICIIYKVQIKFTVCIVLEDFFSRTLNFFGREFEQVVQSGEVMVEYGEYWLENVDWEGNSLCANYSPMALHTYNCSSQPMNKHLYYCRLPCKY